MDSRSFGNPIPIESSDLGLTGGRVGWCAAVDTALDSRSFGNPIPIESSDLGLTGGRVGWVRRRGHGPGQPILRKPDPD
jgi:hypothetical protein